MLPKTNLKKTMEILPFQQRVLLRVIVHWLEYVDYAGNRRKNVGLARYFRFLQRGYSTQNYILEGGKYRENSGLAV